MLCPLAIFCLVVRLISSLCLVATLCSVWSTYCPSFNDGSDWNTNFKVTDMTQPGNKTPTRKAGIEPRSVTLSAEALTTRPRRRSSQTDSEGLVGSHLTAALLILLGLERQWVSGNEMRITARRPLLLFRGETEGQ